MRTYEDEFLTAVEIRKELNGVLHKDYKSLRVVFGALFDVNPSVLKMISDFNYYMGGWPSPDSPSRISKFVENFGTLAKYYSAIGRLDEINELLIPFGFEISPVVESNITVKIDNLNGKVVLKHLKRIVTNYDFKATPDAKDMIEWFLKTTHDLQAEICQKADKIKIDIFDEIKEKQEATFESGTKGVP
jgi:hypothetical protein